MARMNEGKLRLIRTGHRTREGRYPSPEVFVETGTLNGKTTRLAVVQFREVHTVELSPALYEAAVRDLSPLGVRCYHGNSAEIVPRLAQAITEPVCWYLDAHWFHSPYEVAGEDVPLPLWAELDAIARRPYRDVVVVDDVESFGQSNPTPEWEGVSLETIAARFPMHQEALVMWDQAVVYR